MRGISKEKTMLFIKPFLTDFYTVFFNPIKHNLKVKLLLLLFHFKFTKEENAAEFVSN